MTAQEHILALENKVVEYEKRMGIGENDPAKEGYLVLVNILQQQNKYLKSIKIAEMIATEEKGKSSEYERAKALWEKLPTIIEDVGLLKISLKMEGEAKKNYAKPISATSSTDDE